jgi:hypothetical protein
MGAVAKGLTSWLPPILTYDPRMSELMRLANECEADRVDQFYAALHESVYGPSRKWRHVRVESETRSITDIGYSDNAGPAPLARRFLMLFRVVVVIRALVAFAIVSVFRDRAQD